MKTIILLLSVIIAVLGMIVFNWKSNIVLPIIAFILAFYITISILQLNKNKDENKNEKTLESDRLNNTNDRYSGWHSVE
jgi:uncharacterized membrane protein YfcA